MKLQLKSKLVKNGGSLFLHIPAAIKHLFNWEEGTEVIVSIRKGGIFIKGVTQDGAE